MKILLLTNTPNSFSQKAIKSEAEKAGHTVETYCPTDLVPYISSTKSGHDAMFAKCKGTGTMKRIYASHYDVVCARFSGKGVFGYGLAILQHFQANLKIPVSSCPFGLMIASDKFFSHQVLSLSRVRTLPTLFVNQPIDFEFILKTLGLPLVCKTPLGSQGSSVWILETALSTITGLQAYSRINKNLLLQSFIDSGKPYSDIRVWVCDGQILAAMKRFSLDGDFKANYSISKKATPVELTEEEKEMALEAAYAVGLSGMCGVDIIRSAKDGDKPFIVECNGNASLEGISKTTGKNLAAAIVKYLERIAKNGKKETGSGVQNQLKKFVFANSAQRTVDKTLGKLPSGDNIANRVDQNDFIKEKENAQKEKEDLLRFLDQNQHDTQACINRLWEEGY